MSKKTIKIDVDYLIKLHSKDPELLDEMALPSFFHKNPLVRWITHKRTKKTLEYLEIQENEKLLDFGCGAGLLLLQLPKHIGIYSGVDIELWPARETVEYFGREDIKLIHTKKWGGEVPDNSLDYIVATEVLEHIKDLNSILELFHKKLVAGGKLIISLPTENQIYQLGRKIAGFSGSYHHKEEIDIIKACNKASLNIEEQASIPLGGLFCLYKFYLFSKK